jgi:hypothetical protein
MAEKTWWERGIDAYRRNPLAVCLGVVFAFGVVFEVVGWLKLTSDFPWVVGVTPWADRKVHPHLSGVALMALATVVAVFFRQRVEGPSGEPTWSRVVPKLPLPKSKTPALGVKLESIRTVAQARYKELLAKRGSGDIRVDRVRVNVFLPDTEHAKEGEVCGLYIPDGLSRGMKDRDERRIQFRPNEGLTGRVFTDEQAFGAVRQDAGPDWTLIHLEGGGSVGDERFQLTQDQVSQITGQLRWIVSFPLTVKGSGGTHTCGILNVDGLDEPLLVDEMTVMYQALREDVKQFSEALGKLKQRRLSIIVADVR